MPLLPTPSPSQRINHDQQHTSLGRHAPSKSSELNHLHQQPHQRSRETSDRHTKEEEVRNKSQPRHGQPSATRPPPLLPTPSTQDGVVKPEAELHGRRQSRPTQRQSPRQGPHPPSLIPPSGPNSQWQNEGILNAELESLEKDLETMKRQKDEILQAKQKYGETRKLFISPNRPMETNLEQARQRGVRETRLRLESQSPHRQGFTEASGRSFQLKQGHAENGIPTSPPTGEISGGHSHHTERGSFVADRSSFPRSRGKENTLKKSWEKSPPRQVIIERETSPEVIFESQSPHDRSKSPRYRSKSSFHNSKSSHNHHKPSSHRSRSPLHHSKSPHNFSRSSNNYPRTYHSRPRSPLLKTPNLKPNAHRIYNNRSQQNTRGRYRPYNHPQTFKPYN